jgi:NADP-dependent 3-hydroxy acid dehydrogenase YdfG
MSDMNDKVALITGASSGIGRATGAAFAARGAKVVLAARREDELAVLSRVR